MHLTDHLTDVQLNEYLDNETTTEERTQIEAHLSECDECAARLTALQSLFDQIESISDIELTHSIAARFIPTSGLPLPLPRWFTLTATLQAAFALIIILLATPVISRYLTSFLQTYPIPSFDDAVIELQMNLALWIQSIQSFQVPTIPIGLFALPKELPATTLSVTVIGFFIVWVIGNWWLLRKRPNSLA